MAEPEIVPESSFNVQDEQRWGAREVEKVEDVSCPEEKDGSIRVIQEPPQAQTRMPRASRLPDVQGWCASVGPIFASKV